MRFIRYFHPLHIPWLMISAMGAIGCSASDTGKQEHDSINVAHDSAEGALDSTKRARDSIKAYVCSLSKDIPKAVAVLTDHPETLPRGSDNCVIDILDSIENRYIAEGDERYLICMERICDISDGYIGEEMDEAASRMFMGRSSTMVQFMYREESKDTCCLGRNLVWAMRADISGNWVPLAKVDSLVAVVTGSDTLSKAEKDYLLKLRDQWRKKE